MKWKPSGCNGVTNESGVAQWLNVTLFVCLLKTNINDGNDGVKNDLILISWKYGVNIHEYNIRRRNDDNYYVCNNEILLWQQYSMMMKGRLREK